MALVELSVEWVDVAARASTTTVFVRCTRQADASLKQSFLRLEVLCGPRMWRTEIHEKQKPAVLDCSASEFLTALETAFTLGGGASNTRFSYKWSADKAVLTLSERTATGFAMKYASLSFTAIEIEEQQVESWQALLHDVIVQSERSYSETTRQRERIQQLEEMLTKKDALLEAALAAKQRLEDELFTKFCAVLNGKKEEIERLQYALAMANAATNSKTAYKPIAAAKKKRVATPGGRKKTVSAKLSKKQVSEDDSEVEGVKSDGEEDEEEMEDESDASASEDEGGQNNSIAKQSSRSRVKREAVDAYSQLASELQTSSQVCAATDVLDDLDAIMKTEVEHDNEQTASTSRTTRKRPPPSAAPPMRSPDKKTKTTASTPSTREPLQNKSKPKAKPASPSRKPVDSEEEDILDMLS